MTKQRLVALTLALCLALAGCGGDTSVGEGLDVEGLGGNATGPRLGERTTGPTEEPTATAAPEPTVVETQPQPQPQPTAPATQPAAPAPTADPGPQVALEVKIHSDTGPSQFDPSLARIYANSCIRWTNVDTVPRSVEADDGSFSSGGPIAPGGEFVHCFGTPGRFNYHDGTRPYAVAAVEVLAS